MAENFSRLTVHHLRVFLAVAHCRSFTRAADELGLTQSAVSSQIRDMTRILGTPLFDVLGRKVALKRLKDELVRQPEAIRQFMEEARAVNTIRHENIIDVTDGFARNFLDPIAVGILACMVLALAMDLAILLLSRAVTPWLRTGAAA